MTDGKLDKGPFCYKRGDWINSFPQMKDGKACGIGKAYLIENGYQQDVKLSYLGEYLVANPHG